MKQKNLSKSTSFLGGGHRFTAPKCMLCKYANYDDEEKTTTCVAFPNGIPDDVFWDDYEKECGNGIKFEE